MPSPRELPGAGITRQVRARGVRDPRVLDALARIPRARFLPPELRDFAEADFALPIGHDQTISQPFIVAVMTLELALTGPERVLEIGTGSGYQAAVLAHLVSEVYTVERHPTLSLRARAILDGLGLENLHFRIGDGTLGLARASSVRPDHRDRRGSQPASTTLLDELAEGGLLVAPLGPDDLQQITVVRKVQGQPAAGPVLSCRFVKLIGEQGWQV